MKTQNKSHSPTSPAPTCARRGTCHHPLRPHVQPRGVPAQNATPLPHRAAMPSVRAVLNTAQAWQREHKTQDVEHLRYRVPEWSSQARALLSGSL